MWIIASLKKWKSLRSVGATTFPFTIYLTVYIVDCPGVKSEKAGKEDACAGCPNQKICSSGEAAKPDPDLALIEENLSHVKMPIIILSGKGGVGKSTLTSQLAYFLAISKRQCDKPDGDLAANGELNQVGCLDLDLCGPSIPIMMKQSYLENGTEDDTAENSSNATEAYIYSSSSDHWTPHMIEDNLSVMSIGYLLPPSEQSESTEPSEKASSGSAAVIWRGPKKHELIKKFFKNVDWGTLDYLLIDTPPGTSDEHLSLKNLLAFHPLLSAIIVTTPQEISLQDVRKEIDFCRKVKIPILGLIENMSHFKCPNCQLESQIFAASQTENSMAMSNRLGLPFLGSLPLDPILGKACDTGRSIASIKDSHKLPISNNFQIILSSNFYIGCILISLLFFL